MRNFILIFTILLTLTGCSRNLNLNQGIVKSSEPVFIQTKPKNKKTYVKFTNTSNVDSNLTASLKNYLAKSGYEIVADENLATIVVKGNLDYFRRREIYTYEPYYPFWGRRWYYYDDFYKDTEYIYDAGVLLLLRVENEEEKTNLTFQHGGSLYSFSSITEILNYQIYKRVLGYLEGLQSENLDERP